MSKKLSFDLDLNAQGFKQGINEAKGATAEYTNATRDLRKETEDYLKSFGSLTKQMRTAKKEAQDLAVRFNDLSDAEKNSDFGQEMAEELDFAIKKSAELKNVLKDVNDAINREADDVAGLNAIKDAFDIGKDVATAYVGVVGKLTGSEKELKSVVSSLAIVQGSFNAVMKVTSNLQKESNTMLALQRAGVISLAQAEKINEVATKASTIATKALGAAMQMLPYVAVAGGIAAIGVALIKYFSKVDDATVATEKFKKALHDTSIQGQKDAQKEITKLETLYARTQDQTLSMTERLNAVNDMQKLYPAYFGNLTNEAILAGKASGAYQQLRNDIIAVAIARAYEEKLVDTAKENIDLKDQIKTQEEVVARAKKAAEEAKKAQNGQTYGVANWDQSAALANKAAANAKKEEKALANLNNQLAANEAAMEGYRDEMNKTLPAQERVAENIELINEANKKDKKPHKDPVKTRLENLTEEVNKCKKALEDLDETDPDFENLKETALKNLKDAEQAVKDYKIAVSLEVPKSKLEQLKAELKDAEAQLPFAVSDEDIKKAQERIKVAKQAVEKEEIRLGIKVDPEIKNSEEFRNIMEKLYEPPKPKYDFSGLSDAMQEAAEKSLNDINRLETAIKSYRELLKATKEPTLIEQIMEQLRKLGVDLDAATLKVKLLNDQSKSNTSFAKEIRDRGDAFGYYGQMLNGAANGLSALGDSEEVQAAQWAINSAAMIAQCVQNIAAMQAEAIASGTASGARLPFPANLAAIATIVATIGSIFASLPTFEEGGVIPGNSLVGDKVLIRANSRERVLTEEQNKNFEKIANSVSGGAYNTQTIIVEGKIKGKDLLLVQKNYNTTATKAGQSIRF